MELSVLLLATQQAITFSETYGGTYQNFAGLTQFYQDVVPISQMNDYLHFVIEEFSEILDSSSILNKGEIIDSISSDLLFQSYLYDQSTTLSSNIIYDHNNANAIMLSYILSPSDNDFVKCEFISFTLNLKLNEDFIIIHRENKTKNRIIGWKEKVHIPSTLNKDTVIHAFSTILMPLIQSNFTSSSQFVTQLKNSANLQKNNNLQTKRVMARSKTTNGLSASYFCQQKSVKAMPNTLLSIEWFAIIKNLSSLPSLDSHLQWEIEYLIL